MTIVIMIYNKCKLSNPMILMLSPLDPLIISPSVGFADGFLDGFEVVGLGLGLLDGSVVGLIVVDGLIVIDVIAVVYVLPPVIVVVNILVTVEI